ncbi:uncharacterized protein [Zea mays]|uniref:F-box domain-containing protein n=1 Tax=Zea mays TaxID=4577 RepID=A0A1D6F8U9_MAIZE|nr:uncharacterized protein LOC103648231 [Zea mays]ONM27583.1 hypothetical protein ZEAMMB73_Zm00001d007778 [Zea mays]|eukprot:XP_008670944.1 uncharacterized protein LOC103648231 [Zea mays]
MCDIWEEFRAALCISGGNRRPPPTLPPPNLAGGGDEDGGGVESGGGQEEGDIISALPDDVLLFILSRLPSAAAARTSVLSNRWRLLWAQLPVLWFPLPAEPARALPSPATAARTRDRSHRWRRRLLAHLPALRFPLPVGPARALPSLASARAALTQHSAPSLWILRIDANDADPVDAAAVLRLAAPRLTNALFLRNVVPEDRKKAVVMEVIELPCFDRAAHLFLDLGYLRLAFPPSGVFTKLTVLVLSHVRFQGALDIGDTLSSARCPSLRLLHLFDAQGVSNLGICSESLVSMVLHNLKGLQQLRVVSPMLRDLHMFNCFFKRQPVASITAPVADITAPILEKFGWLDEYDPRWVQLGELSQLQVLAISFFAGAWYGLVEHQYNRGSVKLLQRFREIRDLHITIFYPIKIVYFHYCTEGLTSLLAKKLHLILLTCGHAIGSCVFHLLKISTRIRSLFLDIRESIKERAACSPDCACHQQHDWESEELVLNSLQELNVCGLRANRDFMFVKRLLGWMGALKSVTIIFDPKATVHEELCEELLGLSGPETCVKIYLYRDGAKVMYTPVG